LAASVAMSAGSRDGVNWCEAAMSCMVTVTAVSSVLRVPRSFFSVARARV
jgi:hypothetical protein